MERSTSPTPTPPLGRLALLCVPLALVVLAACGGSSGSATSDGVEPAGAGAADLEAYQSCLAEHGVELPARPATGDGGRRGEPPAGGQVPDGGSEGFAAAQEACADLAPEGGFPAGGAGGAFGGGLGAAMTEYTECLTEHGVEVEAPGPGSGQGRPAGEAPDGAGGMFGLDDTDPAVAAALDACADLAPDLPAAGGGR